MTSTINKIYQKYWIAQCHYIRNGEEFCGYMTLLGENEDQAISEMRHYFSQYKEQYSAAVYDDIAPAIMFIKSSNKLELPLIRQLRKQNSEQINAILIDEKNLTNPLPSEKGDIYYQAGAPEFINGCTLYLVIDSGEYLRQTGQSLVPMLYGSCLPWQPLYQGETQTSLEDNAPYLVQILSNKAGQRLLNDYMCMPNKGTLGLFLNSSKPFFELHRQLRKLTYLYNQKLNTWNFFRFYDVTHFIPFIESLKEGQLLNVVSGINAFYGYNKEYIDGIKITFNSHYLSHDGVKESLFINENLYRYYSNLTLIQNIEKAKQLIIQFSPDANDNNTIELDNYCLKLANQSFLEDITQTQAILYTLLARYISGDDLQKWKEATEYAMPYKHNQVLFSYHRYIYCSDNQGVNS